MNLIDKLEAAVASKDRSNLSSLEQQAESELASLRASGQRVYVRKVEELLKQLRSLPVKENFARSPKDFAPQVRLRTNINEANDIAQETISLMP